MDSITYETGQALKFSEEDIFNDGCQPNSGINCLVEISFKEKTLKGFLEKIKDYFGITDEDMQLNACDELGRLDISLYEDENGNKADKRDLELWQKGNKRLWLCDYSYHIHKVTRTDIKL